MATIKPRERQVGQEVPQIGGISPDIGATGTAEAQKLVNVAAGHLETMAKERDSAMAKEAYHEFSSLNRSKLQELRQLKGKDAIKAVSDYETWYQDQHMKMSEGLENKIQQDAFTDQALAQKGRSVGVLMTHQATEHRAYQKSVLQGDLATITSELAVSPDSIDDAVTRANASIDEFNPGIDNTAAKHKSTANLATTSVGMLIAIGQKNKARDVLENYKDILGDAYPTLKKKIDDADLKDESRAIADLAQSLSTDLTEQIAIVRENITDTDRADNAIARLKTRAAEKKAAEKARLEQHISNLTNEAIEMMDGGASQEEVEDEILEAIDDGTEKQKMRKWIRSEFKAEQVVSDPILYLDAIEEIDATADQGRSLDPAYLRRTYAPGLSKTDMQRVINRNNTAARNNARASYKSASKLIDEAYANKRLGPIGKKTVKSKALKAQLKTELEEFVELNPKGDSLAFVESRINVIEQEKLAGKLNGVSDWLADINPLRKSTVERFEELDDEQLVAEFIGIRGDDELTADLASSVGIDPSDLTPEDVAAIQNTTEFLEAKRERAVTVPTGEELRRVILSREFQGFKTRRLLELE